MKEKFRYKFDNIMSKGAVSLIWMLFLITFIVVVLLGVVSYFVTGGSVLDSIWSSLMHTIDAGTIAGDDTSNGWFILVMSLVTLSGLFITSILIGIITTGFEERLNELKKGNSRVIEKNHTVILGFDDSIYTIINELIIANENKKNGRIVILSSLEKEEMENLIKENIDDFKSTKVICRTGNITDINMLKKLSIESSKSVIINNCDDYKTIKAILVLNSYLKEFMDKPYIVGTINNKENYDCAMIAGGDNVEIIVSSELVSKIIAQACRQSGLADVLVELFDYDGCELYFENFKEIDGLKFSDVLLGFESAVVFGYKRDGKILVNPNMNDIMKETDELILLCEDDGVASFKKNEALDYKKFINNKKEVDLVDNILILGENEKLENILNELDSFCYKSSVLVVNDKISEQIKNIKLKNIDINFMECDTVSRKTLDSITNGDITQVLLLSEDVNEGSDDKILLKLIHLKDIKEKNGYNFLVTSEMNEASNQELAKVTNVNDLVIGSNIVNLILTQISENRDLSFVFKSLLESDGSEIYLKNVTDYVVLNKEISFSILTKILSLNNEILVGYKKNDSTSTEIVVNPNKSDVIKFGVGDKLIVISEN